MPLEMKYFVLKPRSKKADDPFAVASRVAMKTFANMIQTADQELARELREWVQREEAGTALPDDCMCDGDGCGALAFVAPGTPHGGCEGRMQPRGSSDAD